jgi:hypothetical protein
VSALARVRTFVRWPLAVGGLFVSALASAAGCPPAGHDLVTLRAQKDANFEMPDDADRQALARALLPCLADPDPALRDGIAFEAYSTWMRAGKLTVATRTDLLSGLVAMLQPDSKDSNGFRQPFAALVLSEVARTDRLSAWMSPAQRDRLVDEAGRYLESVRDYRGFTEKEGWRHGVAHGSDLVLQLVLNPQLDRGAVDRLLAAVAAQVAPPGEHAYVDGESERLARPVLYAASRELHSTEDWQKWLQAVASPAPLPDWGAAFQSRAGLAKRHNLQAFLYALYVNARESGDAGMQALVPALQAVFKTL